MEKPSRKHSLGANNHKGGYYEAYIRNHIKWGES